MLGGGAAAEKRKSIDEEQNLRGNRGRGGKEIALNINPLHGEELPWEVGVGQKTLNSRNPDV